jgi:hypothetical protein
VNCDPLKLSGGEVERLTRKFVSRIHQLLGPYRDVPAPDVNRNAQVMAWIPLVKSGRAQIVRNMAQTNPAFAFAQKSKLESVAKNKSSSRLRNRLRFLSILG